ncbi:MAG: hypothetical protein PHQ66_01525 [Candidatus Nanoarchaeia archaeon]|nr:hypothetical protein [Candidatus Nanoarchaeia archaeon]MDD5357944.1 hypothetical protein [Candidatus Nanoarchaeia archaeon]MDD5588863.1 hypothetical protein [Candidatus Nanoarchaeia archaeon]
MTMETTSGFFTNPATLRQEIAEKTNHKNKMTTDIFDNTILCRKCNTKMQKAKIVKNGFLFRAIVCPKCNEKIIHPADEQEYNKFVNLKNKEFHVKMRLVGNSYAVSIPKEIVSFMKEQEKIMDDMVRLCFEDMGKLSLNFVEETKKLEK